jgi:PPM family protein phosphatase
MASRQDQHGDRTDPFIPVLESKGEEELLAENGAKLVRVRRNGTTQLRWTWEGEPPEHIKKLLAALPDALPGCEDLLLEGAGYTASDFDFTLEDAAPGLELSDALPLIAQALGLDAAFQDAASASLKVFDPSRIYLRNAGDQRIPGLGDYRLRFYHLEDLAPEGAQFGITKGIAQWLQSIFAERKASPAFAGCHTAMMEFLAAIEKSPEKFAGLIPQLKLQLDFVARTHVGLVRDNNEDAYMASTCVIEGSADSSSLFAVADGMGGHNAGELASALCLELLRFYSGLWPLSRGDRRRSATSIIAEHIRSISRELHDSSTSSAEFSGMGTTLTGIYMTHPGSLETGFPLAAAQAIVFNVGDSRAFSASEAGVRALSRDHSLVQEMLDAGSITEEQSYTHPQRNVISQGMGIIPDVKPDVSAFRLPLDAFIVICSDGLSDLVRPARIAELASEAAAPEAFADALVREALSLGGKDNITVIVLMPRLSFAD